MTEARAPSFSEMTVEKLKVYAKEHNIDVPDSPKAAVVEAIMEAEKKAADEAAAAIVATVTAQTTTTPDPEEEDEGEGIGVYGIIDEEFLPFEDTFGSGLSMIAIIESGEDQTEYSASLYFGCDDQGQAIIVEETEDSLQQRLRDIVNKEISNPYTARLIDHRFR